MRYCNMRKDLWKLAVPPLICYFLCLSLTLPLAAQVVVRLVCEFDSNYDLNDDDCGSKRIAQKAGWIVTSMFVASSVPSIIMNGNYGLISDLYGRKYVAIIPFVGTSIYALTLLYVSQYRPEQYIPILLISSFINGFCGLYSVVTMGLFTFAADALSVPNRGNKTNQLQLANPTTSVDVDVARSISTSETSIPSSAETAFAFSIMEGAISFTRLVGPTLGGLLTAEVDSSFGLALMMAVISTVLGGLWVGLVLPAVSIPDGSDSDTASARDHNHLVSAGRSSAIDTNNNVHNTSSEAEDAHLWRHTEAESDLNKNLDGTGSDSQTGFKFDILVTFRNIYWLLVIVPTLVPAARLDPTRDASATTESKQEDMNVGWQSLLRPLNQWEHHQNVIVHLQAVPYFGIGYFLFFTVLIASDAVLLVVFLIHVYDFGPATIGYYVTGEAVAQTVSILLMPQFMQCVVIPAVNRIYGWLRGAAFPATTSRHEAKDTFETGDAVDSHPQLLIPLFSDIHLVCIGHFARASFLLAFGAYMHYKTVPLFLLLLLLVPAQLVMPRTKALLSNCFSISDSFSHAVVYESLSAVVSASEPSDSDPLVGFDSSRPLLSGCKSEVLSAEQCQSKMFSALSSLEMLASFVAPVIGLLYAATLVFYPGVVFILLGGLSAISGVLIYVVLVRKYYDVVDK